MDRPRAPGPRHRRLVAGMLVVAVLLIASGLLRPVVLAALARTGDLGAMLLSTGPEVPSTAAAAGPRYELPDGYAEWVFVGAAAGLSYSETTAGHEGPGAFTHVYLEPAAYRHLRDHGAFPDGTTFVLEIHRAASGGSIARDGWYEGDRLGIHAAVKDDRVDGGWAYLDFDNGATKRARPQRGCASCHAEHGAVDNVFVQFYPVLRRALATSRPETRR